MTTLKTPMRDLHNAGHRRLIGLLPSKKNRGTRAFESLLELDHLVHLEFDTNVSSYQVQNSQFKYNLGGKPRRYTSDVDVVDLDGSIEIREVKPDEVVDQPEWRDRLQAIEESVRSQGHVFRLVLESEFRIGWRIDNLWLLYRYADWPRQTGAREALLKLLPEGREALLGDVMHGMLDKSYCSGHVLRALFERELLCDLIAEELHEGTVIWRSEQ